MPNQEASRVCPGGGSPWCSRRGALLLLSASLGACAVGPDQAAVDPSTGEVASAITDPNDTSPIEPPPRDLTFHQLTASFISYSFACGAHATQHDVMRRSETGEEVNVARVVPCQGTFRLVDSSVQPATSYCYWVIGSNSEQAAASAEACATAPLDFAAPSVPIGAVVDIFPTGATLSFTDTATNEGGFRVSIQREGVGPFSLLKVIRRAQRADRDIGEIFRVEASGLPHSSFNVFLVEVFHDFAPVSATALFPFTTIASQPIP